MAPKRPGPEGPAARSRELLADLVARDLARPAALDEGRAGLEDERLDLHGLAPHDLRDLGVRQVTDLREHDRRTLVLGKRTNVGEQPEHRIREAGGRDLHVLDRLLATGAKLREAAVARDRVEPGLEPDRLAARGEVAVGGYEGLLDSVLGLLLGAEHVAAEREQPAVVAVVDHLECGFVPAPDLVDQALVGEKPGEPARSGYEPVARPRQGRDFHVRIIVVFVSTPNPYRARPVQASTSRPLLQTRTAPPGWGLGVFHAVTRDVRDSCAVEGRHPATRVARTW